MKKYDIEFDGVKYRVRRLYFGFIPVVEKHWVDYGDDMEMEPITFLTFDDAITHVRNKLGLLPKSKREWKVVWRGHKKV